MIGKVIDLVTVREDRAEDERRHRLIGELEDLLFEDMDALFQFDYYCLNRWHRVDRRVRALLIERGILAKDGTLPDRTNEAMYEFRTGHKPFWLNRNRP